MAGRSYPLQIATQDRVVVTADVVSLVAPGVEGKLGILARHAPLLTELTVGLLKVKYPDEEVELVATSGGIMEVSREGVVVLADTAERASDVEIARAKAAKERAERRLRGQVDEEHVDVERARLALLRAINRLNLASGSK